MSAQERVKTRGEMRGVFIFALLAAFALLSLVVVLVGARSYRMINDTAEHAYLSRTGLSYLIGKVRTADEAGQIELLSEDGKDVLALGQSIDGERYLTYIYCREGAVCEYFARANLAYSPEYGEKIFEAEGLNLTLENGLLQIEILDADGETHASSLYLQAAKEGGK